MSVFIVTHKEIDEKIPEGYKIIVVNANRNKVKGDFYDNDFDNISDKNYSYCELTALYSIWKNIKNEDIVGIDHYRRFFIKDNRLISTDEINKILLEYDAILPKKETFKKNVAFKYWSTCGYKNDLRIIEDAIKKISPEYLNTYHAFLKKHDIYLYNMLIMKKEDFDKYCEWLFAILFEIEKTIDADKRKGYFRRVFGFISERLLNVYVIEKKLNIYELPVLFTGEKITFKTKLITKIHKIRDKYL